jgi:electron transport complex protein RnfD
MNEPETVTNTVSIDVVSPEAQTLLVVSAPPHIRCKESTTRIMLWTLIALTPATAMAVMLSGPRELYTILLSVVSATATECGILFFIKKISIPDGSAPLTGLLLALSLPPLMPLWVAPIGSFFAIALVKMAFGGLGRNFLNPALAGRAFLVAAFPVLFSAATSAAGGNLPVPMEAPEINDALLNFLTGYQCGWTGGASAGAVLIGAALLLGLRIIDFTIPLSFIIVVFALGLFTHGSDAFFSATTLLTPLFQLLSSGILFGAIFLATDPVTSPSTKRARLLFGAGCGILTFVFQKYGTRNDSVMQAILLMNCLVPYFERYMQRRNFGAHYNKNVPIESKALAHELEPSAEFASADINQSEPGISA